MAELTVRVDEKPGSLTSRYDYEFRPSDADGLGPMIQEYLAEPSPLLVGKLCGRIDDIVRDALGPAPVGDDPVAELTGKGQQLYRTLFPLVDGNIPDLVQRLGRLTDPLLVRTNESLIPWELLHDGTEFLGLSRELGRQKLTLERKVGGRAIGRLSKALIVGDPNGDLAAARREAEELTAWLAGYGVDCTLVVGADASVLNVFDLLYSGGYDLFHYCGHVAVPVGTKLVGLRLHRDELLDGKALQPLAGPGAPPVVFINGCESASQISDLCSSFMARGSKIAIGTRYMVEEDAARRFSEVFYAELIAGARAGAAIRAARVASRRDDLCWTAFVLYGDPSVRISTGMQPVPAPEEPVRGLDAAATELMERVVRQGAGHGIVTSMDLLAELLSTDLISSRMQDPDSVERLVLAGELLRSVLDIGPTAPAVPTDRIEYSDTVETVLTQAEQRAHEDGRKLITTADLVAAFTEVGGGSARQVLDLFHISLDELAGTAPPQPVVPPQVGEPMADESVNGHPVPGPLFDSAGRLRTDTFAPDMVAALRVAALLASVQHTVISTGLLLYGLAITDNAVFTAALRAQGGAGATALETLSLSGEMRQDRFSPRTLRALERAAGAGTVADASILREITVEQTSTARQLLERLGVDPEQFLRTLGEAETTSD